MTCCIGTIRQWASFIDWWLGTIRQTCYTRAHTHTHNFNPGKAGLVSSPLIHHRHSSPSSATSLDRPKLSISLWHNSTRAVSRTLFSYKNLGSTAREFLQKWESLRCENSTLAIICPLLLTNSINVTFLWAGLAKRIKEISCSRNLVAARDFYDARLTFYASSYENPVEKKCETHHRSSSDVPSITKTCYNNHTPFKHYTTVNPTTVYFVLLTLIMTIRCKQESATKHSK